MNNLQNLQRFYYGEEGERQKTGSEQALFAFHDENLRIDSPMKITYNYYVNSLGLREMSENGKLI